MKNTAKSLLGVLLVLMLCVLAVACAHGEDEHIAAGDWQSDATYHWKGCEDECEGAQIDKAEHTYTNACDTDCNVCGATRSVTHDHADTLTAGETTHWYACSVCGNKKDEAAHAYTVESATAATLKQAATATTKAQYYKSCACGAISATEYFESDKSVATVTISVSGNKTYDGAAVAAPTYTTTSDATTGIQVLYKVKDAADNTYTATAPVNAGTYTVKVIVPETTAFAGASATADLTIAKGAAEITDIDVEGTKKTYDSNPVNAPTFTANFRDGAIVEYKRSSDPDTAYSANAPADAGIYTVRVRVPGTDNYNGAELTKNFAILKATATIESVTMSAATIVYGDSYEVMVNASGFYGENPQILYKAKDSTGEFDAIKPTNAGAYTAKVVLPESANSSAAETTIDFTITKKALTALNAEVVYNATDVHEISLDTIENGLVATLTFDSKDVGASVVGVMFNSANFEIALASCDVDIVPKTITAVWGAPNLAYTGTAKVPYISFMGVCGIGGIDEPLNETLTLTEGDDNINYYSTFTYEVAINNSNYVLDATTAISPEYTITIAEHSTDLAIQPKNGYFVISLGEGTYAIDKSELTAGSFSLSFVDPTMPGEFAFTVFSDFGSLVFTLSDTSEYKPGRYLVQMDATDAEGTFKIRQDSHDQMDEYGRCTICGEWLGAKYNTNGNEDLSLSAGEKGYYRFELYEPTGDILLNIKFADKNGIASYTAYNEYWEEINLTETPDVFVSTKYVYVIVEANADVNTSIMVEETGND